MTLRIITFGTLSVRSDRGTVAGAAAQPRRLALLALLARAGDRGVTREKVTALIWPDADDEKSRRAITQGIYALRQELGSDDAILGVRELRLNLELVTSDIYDFAAALRGARAEDAVRLYAGPFLDGFHLPGNEEFDRWVDDERSSLARQHSEALEQLAVAADARGDHGSATKWWRRLSARDPLSARYAIGVMRALMADGDKHGALEHARVHETLLEQQLDLPADRDVVALAARIRRELRAAARAEAELQAAESAVGTAVAEPPGPVAPDTPAPDTSMPNVVVPDASEPNDPVPPPRRRAEAHVVADVAPPVPSGTATGRRWRRVALIGVALAATGAAALMIRALRTPAESGAETVVAVGRITDYSATADRRYGPPLSDLLSTNLARVPGMRVVSGARMLELIRRASASGDTSAGAVLAAARLAGATELVDGIVYTRPDGRLRLDLRRIGLRNGDIIEAQTVEGADLFALVDSGTARLITTRGGAPLGSVAGVTTRSVAAYSLYAQGLRASAEGDATGARRLFAAALDEDSSFAMAAYHYGRLATKRADIVSGFARALRLSARATERERLSIRAGWAWTMSAAELGAVADTLVTRYPQETQGHLFEGIARLQNGDFLDAVAPLQRVVTMDSVSFAGLDSVTACDACDAMAQLILVYELADSLGAAEREARRWVGLDPRSARPLLALWDVLERAEKFAEARQVSARARQIDHDAIGFTERTVFSAIRMGDFEEADRVARAAIERGASDAQMTALWDLNISLRYQGRVSEAADVARRFRVLADRAEPPAASETSVSVRPLAQSLFDAGRYREAAILFDSSATWRASVEGPWGLARARAWSLAHAARSWAAAGDTAGLAARADSIASVAALSNSGRDKRLPSYIHGLLFLARGDTSNAMAAISNSIYSLPAGYTRENYDLARLQLRVGRPRDAIASLQPIMRGKLDASNMYVTQTEVHELLAQAWEAAGRSDSASAHYARVARAWEHGDPPYAQRAEEARRRISRTVGAR
jgi:DNA-binding SARP family transcriptional activator